MGRWSAGWLGDLETPSHPEMAAVSLAGLMTCVPRWPHLRLCEMADMHSERWSSNEGALHRWDRRDLVRLRPREPRARPRGDGAQPRSDRANAAAWRARARG